LYTDMRSPCLFSALGAVEGQHFRYVASSDCGRIANDKNLLVFGGVKVRSRHMVLPRFYGYSVRVG
jgi:hypothetical protein